MSSLRRTLCRTLLIFGALPAAAHASVANPSLSPTCLQAASDDWRTALTCYVDAVREEPLSYKHVDTRVVGNTRIYRFELHSQDWAPAQASHPSEWHHDIRIVVPTVAKRRTAILVVSDGTRHSAPDDTSRPADSGNEATLRAIAEQTQGIVVEISDVPNQYLRWDDGAYRKEDQAVAHSWKLALQGGPAAPFTSLHLPMAAATVRAMDLAERELRPWGIRHFVVTGTSKRGWATWLAALSDDRVAGIAPIAIDVLGTEALIERTRMIYGGEWPVAFFDYWQAGVLRERHTPAFARLMRVEDPLAYLDTRQGRRRLRIPKLLISASGDDFFVPDNVGRHLSRLPAPTLLRALPNSDHGGAAGALPDAIVPFIKRVMDGKHLPRLGHRVERRDDQPVMRVTFDEQPVALVRWTASNGSDRDFRFACGIRYVGTPLEATRRLDLPLSPPPSGWTATFVEASFADGLVVTTPIEVWPDTYPDRPPATTKPSCATLPEA
jgi:PhoPQ-activated pathogenicity-related protein